MKLSTTLVQTGVGTDKRTGSISTPIYQAATFQHPGLGESTGFDYSRTINPTRKVLEDGIARLEGGSRGFAYASGMAAITSLLLLFQNGDHLVVSDDLYGGTYRLLMKVFNQLGITASFVNTADPSTIEPAIKENTRALFIETPTNPLMKITDIRRCSDIADAKGILTIVDNTFMTPYLQQPLALGADIVIHSGTKYLGGHNDLVAGLVVVKDPALADRVAFIQNSAGAVLGPQDSWLLIRGLKTLAIRMDRQQANAQQVAEWLVQHSLIDKVFYPGLPDHPGHALCRRQAEGFGGMISFTVKNTELVKQILGKVQLIAYAESLGGVESLITYPATQTHGDIPVEIRNRIGVTDCLLRISVGIEDIGDILADLAQALG